MSRDRAPVPARGRIALVVCAALLASGAAAGAAPGNSVAGPGTSGPERFSYLGLDLPGALAELQSRGLRILFSSALVRSDMRVAAEPRGSSPREVLADLLRPHGLAVHDGPDGTLLVVPGRLSAPRPRPAIRGVVYDRNTRIAVAGAEVRLVRPAGATPWTVGPGTPTAHTAADGTFELTGVVEGVYRLEAHNLGYTRRSFDLRVLDGQITEVAVELLPIPVTLDEIEVVPQLEVGSIHSGTILHRTELERIPTPRDPWAVVTQTPAILSDRVNVGGSESGVQALFLAPASTFEENVFVLDGVNTTDMAAVGASSIYYDFDQFEELRISTGGSDVKTATAGVAIRMITKRGTDDPRGSVRLLSTDDGGIFGLLEQGSSRVGGQLAPGQQDAPAGNKIDSILDYGFELGGPLRRESLWGWVSVGANEIELATVGGFSDDTLLENAALKVNAGPAAGNSLVVSAHRGAKSKENRGAGPGRAVETTWRQRGPTYVYRVEDSHVVSSRLLLTGEYNFLDGGFSLIPVAGAGPAGGEALLDSDGVWKNGYIGGTTDRDSETFEAEGSRFFETGRLGHGLDFGGSYRTYRFFDDFRWSGPRQAYNMACENTGTCTGDGGDLVLFERRGDLHVDLDYTALWVQDAMAAGRWTWTAGLRLDLQDGRNPPGSVAPNPVLPEELPGVDYPGAGAPFDWSTLAPRLAASYALDEEARTVLRLSFGRFAEQLGAADVLRENPLDSAFLLYSFEDANGDNVWQDGEPLELVSSAGIDPAHPTVSPHRTDPGLEPETTTELLIGLERAFSAEWILGVNATFRRISDVPELRALVRDGGVVRVATSSDYVLERVWDVELPGGSTRSAFFYALEDGLVRTGGQLLTNGDRAREYAGLTLSFNRRPTDRWMMRGYVTWGEATWEVPASFFAWSDPTDRAGIGDNDEDLFAAQGRGFREDVFLQSTWSMQWSGYFRVAPERRWGFTVASNLFAREGYPLPYMARFISRVDGIDREGQLTEGLGEFRVDDLFVLDLSLEKELRFRDRIDATLSLSAFNLLNENFVLQRERNLTGARGDHLDETLAPRIVRLGIRVSW